MSSRSCRQEPRPACDPPYSPMGPSLPGVWAQPPTETHSPAFPLGVEGNADGHRTGQSSPKAFDPSWLDPQPRGSHAPTDGSLWVCSPHAPPSTLEVLACVCGGQSCSPAPAVGDGLAAVAAEAGDQRLEKLVSGSVVRAAAWWTVGRGFDSRQTPRRGWAGHSSWTKDQQLIFDQFVCCARMCCTV